MALCVKFHVQTLCSLGVMSEKPSRKLENAVSTILVFSKEMQICIFFTLDDNRFEN